jgi:hypothetical protein
MAPLNAFLATRNRAVVVSAAGVGGAVVGFVLGWALDPGPTCPGGGPTMCLAAGGGLGMAGYVVSAVAMAVASCALCIAGLRQHTRTLVRSDYLVITVALSVGVAALVWEFLFFRSVL